MTFGQRLAKEKAKYALHLISDIEERKGKCLVFTQSTSVRDQICTAFDGIKLTAEMDASERSYWVQLFQKDPNESLFIATPQICAEGITLTAADTVIFLDTPWSPGLIEQAQSRAYRKGQDKPVHVYYLQSATRYDQVVREAIERKQEVTEMLLEERCK
jgi:SNF2 family DNA or RNA helicase